MNRSFLSLSIIRSSSDIDGLKLAAYLLNALQSKELFETASLLVNCFPNLKEEARKRVLITGVLTYISKASINSVLAIKVLKLIQGFEELAELAGTFFLSLIKSRAQVTLETVFCTLTTRLDVKCALSLTLLFSEFDDIHCEEFAKLIEVSKFPQDVGKIVDGWPRENRRDCLMKTLICFKALREQSGQAASDFVSRIIMLHAKNNNLMDLVENITTSFCSGPPQQGLALKLASLWAQSSLRCPRVLRLTCFCNYILKQKYQEESSALIDEFLEIVLDSTASYSTAISLTRFYRRGKLPNDNMLQFFCILRRLKGADSLETLFLKVNDIQLAEPAAFLETILLLSVEKPSEITRLAKALHDLLELPAASSFTKLSNISDKDVRITLLGTIMICQDSKSLQFFFDFLNTLVKLHEQELILQKVKSVRACINSAEALRYVSQVLMLQTEPSSAEVNRVIALLSILPKQPLHPLCNALSDCFEKCIEKSGLPVLVDGVLKWVEKPMVMMDFVVSLLHLILNTPKESKRLVNCFF